ncbi:MULTISPECIES: NAD(P)-dependent oxidoreductase [Apibacter]|uniref:NAD(P)-dependent oxidoreductase n=1 Tax=Apibacter TaxID=1778601 RepID=UPI00132B3120|nr:MULTISPECIES: NAD(P)-dependent oxidoreductase [Apibacter]MCX8676636.1 NAD(P)-dependent oxidoreductase [Apibacter sp. B3919]MXO24094.1 NAD(P)H-binding protein [Apibacter sp. B3924]MXO26225.1 NAD(P)H-binding protein [Apibacter sp. B3813]MXO28176.1 NAD(P)H-binding protein [Apibacter sp. B3913]MXO30130.1 NAD(P)H-binding protein [Apibacter sp. B3912]
MKKVALIGASGFIGSQLVKELLSRGYQVTAIVRSADKIKNDDKNLKVVSADVFDTDKLAEVLKNNDAVISAYNPGWTNPNIYDDTIKGYQSIIEAVKKAGIKRLQAVGGAGSLLVAPGKTVVDSGAIPDEILPGVKALALVLKDQFLPEKELDWVFFSPAGTIEPGERTGKYRLGLDNLITDDQGNSKISVQDYAKAMVDELENPKHHQQRFTIGY